MVKRVSTARTERPGLRDLIAEHYAAFVARYHPPSPSHRLILEELRAGEPIVLAGWELGRYKIPQVRPGVHAFYRVEADGRVVEVVPRRSPSDPDSIVGWDAVPDARVQDATGTQGP